MRLSIERLHGFFELSLDLFSELYLLVPCYLELSLLLLPLFLFLLLFFLELLLKLWLVGKWGLTALIGIVMSTVCVLWVIRREVVGMVFIRIRRRMVSLLMKLLLWMRFEVVKLLRLGLFYLRLGLHDRVHLLHRHRIMRMAKLHREWKWMRATRRHLVGILKLLVRMHVRRILRVIDRRKMVNWRQVHVRVVKLRLGLGWNCWYCLIFPCW